MDDLRKEKRAPILLKVKYKSASVEEFIQQSGLDISRGGIFIKTKTPMEIGTVLKFEFQLSDGAPVIHGVGRVAWRREADVSTRDLPPGMGVKFIKLDPESRTVVDRTVSQRGAIASRYDAVAEEGSGAQPNPTEPQAPAAPVAPPAAPPAARATSSAAASALNPTPATLPLPPTSKAPTSGARPAPPGVFSTAKAAAAAPAPTAPARARDSASGRATMPSADPFADAAAPASFFPKGPPAPAPATEDSTQVRHVSEFLASAMSAAGATDETIAAEAQAGATKARKREHEVEEQRLGALEAQLFGDMGEQTVSVPLKPVSLSPRAAVEKDFDPFASDAPSGSPELAPPMIASVPGLSSMQASLAPSSKAAETGRQQDFGAAHATASEAKFAAPSTAKPGAGAGQFPSLPAPKKSSNAWVPLVVVGALLGGGAYWYLMLGGAQTIAGTPAQPPVVTAEPVAAAPNNPPAPEPTPEPVAAEPAPTEPAPTEPTPTEPTPTEAAPVVMTEVQVTSVPKDATVTIDGVAQGVTPKRLQLAVGSTVNVTVSAFGHKPMTQTYTVAPKNDPLRFKLETMSFVLTVRTVPSDAHVTVRGLTGDNAQPMDLGFLSGSINVTVSKSGFEKKQKLVTPQMFIEQNGVMVAGIEVGLRRPGGAAGGDEPAGEPTGAAPAPIEAAPTPRPAPEPVAEPEPEPAPRPAPKPEPAAPALPDNPF